MVEAMPQMSDRGSIRDEDTALESVAWCHPVAQDTMFNGLANDRSSLSSMEKSILNHGRHDVAAAGPTNDGPDFESQ